MREKLPSKTLTMMVTITGILSVMLIFMMGTVFAQVGIGSNGCPDKCEGDILYLKGVYDERLGVCIYAIEEPCKYDCKDRTSCSEFPDTPPTNEAEFDETLWMMQREVYDSARIEVSTGATEYTLGDNATIFAKVTDMGEPVSDAFCDVLIFAPNQTEIAGFPLDYINGSRGIYSSIYSVPDEYGVYIVDVDCFRPFNSSIQTHYFQGEGMPAYDLFFKNQSGTNQTRIELSGVGSDIYCHPDRWSQSYSDFASGEFEEFRFLGSVENISIWVYINLPPASPYTLYLRFYKEALTGEVSLGAVINTTTIGSSPLEITFPDTDLNTPWDDTCLLEVEFCAKTSAGGGKDVYMVFNSSTYDSQFTIHTLSVNATVDFRVGGSSEIHVSDIPYETYLTFVTMPEPILESNHDFCVDNDTMGKTLTWEQCLAGRCDNYSRNETVECPYGCYGNETVGQCNPAPFDRMTFIALIFIIIIVIIVAMAITYDRFVK